ncbi:MAG TPA: HesA/MoeB/ThiF family protein [Methanoregulaceae archaeon]|nr:HesA/MoeB/ThiF family protein [Methanoregulaceae archaeon]
MFDSKNLERYRRQFELIGERGQRSLHESRVFLAGAGGIGSPVALYLAAAGVGHIRIVDDDVVDLTNLNRQILHGEPDIGKLKVTSAAEKINSINSGIDVDPRPVRIDAQNVWELIEGMDLIVDALDNYPARYILNVASIKRKIPYFHGAVRGFSGQVTTIIPGDTPCLECIFPQSPPEENTPVMGTTAGIIGLIQANEVIKYLLGKGDLITNRLLIWDGLSSELTSIPLEKYPGCRRCSNKE